ncbi:MBL fold metallo-hydrolase [Clostridium aestuarii]|uniref:MBL fold metallo-hydrolase n=1 Tax=Clostridium aestuarii TaxID=338193 RepID=A0ABT4D1S9_9CLOT|nr:MBL fold metallo-hydrolase [Clostridium aestuarii]MCY6485181.1 MBL fold metallo-hydrolase [Clostridium aestuarii]
MKITTLIENTLGENKSLINEHGLSFFIETSEGNILFDTGQSGDFIKNAKALNIDLNKTDYLLLSHAHYDHCGGVKKYLDSVDIKPDLYISKYFFDNSDKYHIFEDSKDENALKNGFTKYIGINFSKDYIMKKQVDINYITGDFVKLTSKISVHTNFKRECNFEYLNENLKMKINNTLLTDNFKDEIAISITTEKGLLILVGCSHPGIVNIINTIQKRTGEKIYGVIGGTHLIEADNSRIEKTIQYFNKLNIKLIGVSHCTGENAINKFKNSCDNFFINCTGKIIVL